MSNPKHHEEYMPNQPGDEQDDNIDTRKGQPTADELNNAPRKYNVYGIACNVREGGDVMYAVC